MACYPHNQLFFFKEKDQLCKRGFIPQWFDSIVKKKQQQQQQKEGNCSGRSRVRRILLTCIPLLLLQFLHVIWSMHTNVALFKNGSINFFIHLIIWRSIIKKIYPASFPLQPSLILYLFLCFSFIVYIFRYARAHWRAVSYTLTEIKAVR